MHATSRSPAGPTQPFQQTRQGSCGPMVAGSGIFPSPDPVHGGVGSHHGSSGHHAEHSRYLFEEGPSPVLTSSGGSRNFNSVVEGVPSPDAEKFFDITLIYEGDRVRHQVAAHMPVAELSAEAAAIFQINAADVILLLYGIIPRTLPRNGRISDPPRVIAGSTVLVFCVATPGHGQGGYPPPASPNPRARDGDGLQSQFVHTGSKILGNFQLPKFDGNARTWDKTFVRYLSIHQLDFVIEESFLNVLPLSPRDFGANKMVYYILEDAITPGSIAGSYMRQAAKWNGNEAYSRLYNGYAFSGPQTMALLFAELVNLRFKYNESVWFFFLCVLELFEVL
jgi:hypothetical protein